MAARDKAATHDAAVTDRDREISALLLQRACGEGRLSLEDFTERVGAVWAAETAGALAEATADVGLARTDPAPGGLATPIVGSGDRDSRIMINVIGDRTRLGRWRVTRWTRLFSLIGDWRFDLRGALVSERAMRDGLIEMTFISVIGDLKLVVPEGVEVEFAGFSLIGDEKVELAPVPLRHGTPRVKVHVFSLIGDVVVRSAPAGR